MQNQETLYPTVNQAEATREQAAAGRFTDAWFVTGITVIVLVITSIPYLYGFLTAPAGTRFMGIMLDVPDHAQYFSWMHDFRTATLVSNKLTPEYNLPIFFNLLWWGMARIGALLNANYAVMYQGLRLVATVAFFIVIYLACWWFLEGQTRRRTAFLIAVFSSGLGWVLVLLKYVTGKELLFPQDVFIAEGNTFLGVLGYPHFIAAALYVSVFLLVLYGQKKKQLRYAVIAGLVALFLGWQHTYDLVSVYGVLGAYGLLMLLRDRRIPWSMVHTGIIIGVLSCSPAIYSVWLTTSDPIWKQVLAQFANAGVYTPNLLHLPILLGFTFILALFTALKMNPFNLQTKTDSQLFLLGWFFITFVLIYLPVDYQVHLLNGWQVPMAILATMGLFDHIIPWVQTHLRSRLPLAGTHSGMTVLTRGIVLAFLILILPTNAYLLSWRFYDLSRHTYPYYLHTDELSAMDWLENHARAEDVVLASLTIGQYIPAMTGAHTYLGHWAQTLNFFAKSTDVDRFYSAQTNNAEREAILQKGKIRYVFYGPAEQAMGAANLNDLPGMSIVYTSPKVTIFSYKP